MSTCGTTPRRVRRADLHKDDAGLRTLVMEPLVEQAPATSENLTIQGRFRADVPPRHVDCALSRTGHVTDFEGLHRDEVIIDHEAGGRLFNPVFRPVSLGVSEPGDGQFCAISSPASIFLSGQLSLQLDEAGALGRVERWGMQHLAVAGSDCVDHASVNADGSPGPTSVNRVRDARESDVPAAATVEGYPVRLDRSDPSGPPEPDPADLRNQHLTPSPVQPVDMPIFYSDNPEALVDSALTPSRSTEVARIQPPVLHRLGEVTQSLLLHDDRPGREPVGHSSSLGQLATLLVETRRWSPFGPIPTRLLQCQVPYEASMRAVPAQEFNLGHCRIKPVSHFSTLSGGSDKNSGLRFGSFGPLAARIKGFG